MYTFQTKNNGRQYSIFGVPDTLDFSYWGGKTPYQVAMKSKGDKEKIEKSYSSGYINRIADEFQLALSGKINEYVSCVPPEWTTEKNTRSSKFSCQK